MLAEAAADPETPRHLLFRGQVPQAVSVALPPLPVSLYLLAVAVTEVVPGLTVLRGQMHLTCISAAEAEAAAGYPQQQRS